MAVSSNAFGDECPGTPKYLEMAYSCVQATTTTTTTTPLPTTTTTSLYTTPSDDAIKSSLTSSLPTSAPKFCQPKYERYIQFPKTESGTNAKASCPVNTYGEAEWFCSIEGKWEGTPDLSNCVSIWIKKLGDDVESSPKDLVVQMETLKEIQAHSKRQRFVGGELIKISTVVEKVVHNYISILKTVTSTKENFQQNKKMNEFLLELINSLLSSLQKDAWTDIDSSKQRSVATKLLDSSEKLLSSVFTLTPMNGKESMSEMFIAKPNIRSYVAAISTYYNYAKFPSMEWGYGGDIVHIPKEALEVSGGHYGQAIYSNLDGFQRYLQPLKNPEHQYPKVLASKILTVSIVRDGRPQPVHRIARPVILEFHTEVSKNLTNPQCVWWDQEMNDWSGNGCTLKNSSGSITVCECSHLTHFAILMDVRGIQLPIVQEMMLTVVTYFGCSLSIICLLFSFAAFFIFSDRSCDRNTIHMNLSLTLAIAEIVFLLGIYRTDDRLTCTIVAAVLQYFFLSAFCWMALEGLQLYFMLVQVFSSKRSRKPLYYICAYGFPAIVSGASFYWNPQGFGTERHCWLSTENYFIWTFVGPAATVLFCNLLFLLMTFCIVCKHSNVGYKPCKHDYDTIRMIRAWLKGSFALIFLLGLTWMWGFLWIDQRTVWVAYVFTVFNTLQGVCIFVFHIWLNDKMHADYENWVRRNDWLPSCLRDPTLNIRDRRTGPYVPSTATSSGSAHTGDSSNGSDGMYPGQQWTLDRFGNPPISHAGRRGYNPSLKEAMGNGSTYQQQPQQHHHRIPDETYDYATIPYDDAMNKPYPNGATQFNAFRTNYGVDLYPSSNNTLNEQHFPRPPPNFKPPPPPQITGMIPVSDDSAYSDSGASSSRSPNSAVSRNGTMLLRMDLSKESPIFVEHV